MCYAWLDIYWCIRNEMLLLFNVNGILEVSMSKKNQWVKHIGGEPCTHSNEFLIKSPKPSMLTKKQLLLKSKYFFFECSKSLKYSLISQQAKEVVRLKQSKGLKKLVGFSLVPHISVNFISMCAFQYDISSTLKNISTLGF